jgi:hypothetical protein
MSNTIFIPDIQFEKNEKIHDVMITGGGQTIWGKQEPVAALPINHKMAFFVFNKNYDYQL